METQTELQEVNNELADFLGEDKKNLPQPVEVIEPEIVEEKDTVMNLIEIKNMTEEEKTFIDTTVNNFIEKVKNNPTDMTLSTDVYKIGNKSASISLPQVSLYEKLISEIMKENQKGEETEGTKDFNLLRLKRELDMINPSVLAKTPIKQKVLMFFNKEILPGSVIIMSMIYERQETVKSTIDGLKVALKQNADDLDNQLADLMMVYKGLMKSHRHLQTEIYIAQVLFNKIREYNENLTDNIEKENIKAVLADITTQTNSLIVEENMNMQFFAGSQLTAKLVREQQQQIRILVRQMEKSVLANLGLRVVSESLATSVETSKKLGNAISNTIADTAKMTGKTQEQIQQSRIKGYINLDKLQEGVDELEASFKRQAMANELIVKQGVSVVNQVRETTKRLETKIDKTEMEG